MSNYVVALQENFGHEQILGEYETFDAGKAYLEFAVNTHRARYGDESDLTIKEWVKPTHPLVASIKFRTAEAGQVIDLIYLRLNTEKSSS